MIFSPFLCPRMVFFFPLTLTCIWETTGSSALQSVHSNKDSIHSDTGKKKPELFKIFCEISLFPLWLCPHWFILRLQFLRTDPTVWSFLDLKISSMESLLVNLEWKILGFSLWETLTTSLYVWLILRGV